MATPTFTADAGKHAAEMAIALEVLARSLSEDGVSAAHALRVISENAEQARRDSGGFGERAAGWAGRRADQNVAQPLNLLVKQFAQVIGPLALMGAIIQSNATGFQLLGAAIKVLVATLGPILLPIVAVLAAALLDLSDAVWNKLRPKLGEWFDFIVGTVIPALKAFADAVVWVAEKIRGAREFVREAPAKAKDWLDRRMDDVRDAKDWVSDKLGMEKTVRAPKAEDGFRIGGIAELVDKHMSKLTKMAGGAGGSPISDRLREMTVGKAGGGAAAGDDGLKPWGALKDIIKEFQNAIGPRAQFSGLAQVSRHAQLAAINASPIEQRIFERISECLNQLMKIAEHTKLPGGRLG